MDPRSEWESSIHARSRRLGALIGRLMHHPSKRAGSTAWASDMVVLVREMKLGFIAFALAFVAGCGTDDVMSAPPSSGGSNGTGGQSNGASGAPGTGGDVSGNTGGGSATGGSNPGSGGTNGSGGS